MKIGNLEIENNVFLAPMAGITDLPFRLLCKRMGCGLVYTEMVSAKALSYNNKKTENLMETLPEERPAALQLFGSEPEVLAKMASKVSNLDIDIIDINMGCPAPKITKNGEGSALLKNPELVGEIVKAVSESTKKPVTIKIRKGFDDLHINAVDIAKTAEANGASAIAIHGRTARQMYSGKADWDIIKQVKSSVSIPVIGNGDVTDPISAKALLSHTGCDGIMIGRGACGNPWIFKQINHYLKYNELLPEPSLEEKREMASLHCKMLTKYKGEYIGIREMRKHLGFYSKGIYGASEMRSKGNQASTLKEMLDIISKYFR